MKNYTITVNGNIYDVTVEEKGSTPGFTAPRPSTPVPAPAASTAAPAAALGAGSIPIEAGASGKVFKIEAAVGDKLKMGDPILVLEIMKMETPVVAPKDGILASIQVSEGQNVEAGEVLATMNE